MKETRTEDSLLPETFTRSAIIRSIRPPNPRSRREYGCSTPTGRLALTMASTRRPPQPLSLKRGRHQRGSLFAPELCAGGRQSYFFPIPAGLLPFRVSPPPRPPFAIIGPIGLCHQNCRPPPKARCERVFLIFFFKSLGRPLWRE